MKYRNGMPLELWERQALRRYARAKGVPEAYSVLLALQTDRLAAFARSLVIKRLASPASVPGLSSNPPATLEQRLCTLFSE
jgi:hypothetical protein